VGLQRVVKLSHGEPSFVAVAEKWAESGEPLTVRMIDGLPAFPDEMPPDGWKEVRVSVPSGMITLRREAGQWACVVWGSADNALLTARDQLCDTIASVGRGTVSDG